MSLSVDWYDVAILCNEKIAFCEKSRMPIDCAITTRTLQRWSRTSLGELSHPVAGVPNGYTML